MTSRLFSLFTNLLAWGFMAALCAVPVTLSWLSIEHVHSGQEKVRTLDCIVESVSETTKMDGTVERSSWASCRTPEFPRPIVKHSRSWPQEWQMQLRIRMRFTHDESWVENVMPFLGIRSKSSWENRNFRIVQE